MKPTLLLNSIVCLFIGTFTFSQTPPSNNNPADATALTVGSGFCSGNTSGDVRLATNSGVAGPSCSSGLTSDVWYTAEVPSSGNLIIEIFNVGSTSFDSVLTVYSGTLGNLSELACDDQGGQGNLSKVVLTGQTPGVPLYIRVWGYNGDRNPFEICAWEFTSPTNDNPADATALTVGSGSCSGNTSGDVHLATNSGVAGPSCGFGLTSDVWYTAEVPSSGNLIIEIFNVGSTSFDSVLTVYSGTLGNLSELACDNQGGQDNLSKVVLTGQTPGVPLYIRVWGYAGVRKPFEICAWSSESLSISENGLETLKVYPNPTTNILHIEAQIPPKQASVYSLTGAQILTPVLLVKNTSLLDVSVLPTGIYMLQITHDKGSAYIKFVKE